MLYAIVRRNNNEENPLYFFLIITLYGCATKRGYERVLQSWIGHKLNELIQSWDPPSNVYDLPDSKKLYTWYFEGGTIAFRIGIFIIHLRFIAKQHLLLMNMTL